MVKQISTDQIPELTAVSSLGERASLDEVELDRPGAESTSSVEASPSGYTLDVSEQHLFKAAFENAGDALMIIDSDHRIVAFNRASENLTRWRSHQAVGRYCWEVYHCSDDSIEGQSGTHCPLAGEKNPSSCIQHTLARSGGKEIAVSLSLTPLLPSTHENRYQIVAVQEVSASRDMKHIEPELFSVASHELLSPLNLLRGYIATLLEFGETLTPAQKTRYLRGIESSTNRAIRLVKNYLDVSRLEAGHLDLVAEPTSIPDLLRRVVTEIQAQTTDHVIKLHRPRTLPLVKIDRQKIEQVMTNLLLNAMKYSPQGSHIEVSVKQARDKRELTAIIEGESSIRTPCVIITVKDSGVGIPGVELEKVFEKFYRVHNKMTHTTSGIGLGLYICKAIVEAHGGRIWAKSKDGEGSTFIFSLPVAKPVPTGQQ